MSRTWKTGGCHCSAVEWQALTDDDVIVHQCDCTICQMLGYLHLMIPADNFKLVRGQADLSTYTFNTGTAKHTFCRHCGIKSFYTPRSHPDGFSLNVRCMQQDQFARVTIEAFDGKNWEQGVAVFEDPSRNEVLRD